MRRKYKVIIILLISAVLTYFIYFVNREEKINILVIGDGIASGETSYNIDGISYNDYLKEYFENKHLLKTYNNTYAYKNFKLEDLIEDLKSNITEGRDKLTINQLIHKSDVITISIGEEELIKAGMTDDLNKDYIDKLINDFDSLLFMIKDITESKIIIIGFYENNYLDKSNVIILNSELSNIAIKYEVTFININDLLLNDDYFLDNKSYYFNYKAHKEIAEMIIHSL